MGVFLGHLVGILDMTKPVPDLSTDASWEEWGQRDPYFGVITHPKFRRTELNEQAKQEFFESGRGHVNYVMQTIRRYLDPHFHPETILEFGCGVGRLLVPFSTFGRNVVGLDISPSMLREARRNCNESNVKNVLLLASDDSLSSLDGAFDLIHSCITFQHIQPARGREILRALLTHIAPRGIGALHFLYSKSNLVESYGVLPSASPPQSNAPIPKNPDMDPEIQMNPYNLTEIFFLLQSRGVSRFHADFTDHGGELGLFIFFQLP